MMSKVLFIAALICFTLAAPQLRGTEQKTLTAKVEVDTEHEQCDGSYTAVGYNSLSARADWCSGKATGSYSVQQQGDGDTTYECNGDDYNGGWLKVGTYDEAAVSGDRDPALLDLPTWYDSPDMGGCNQFLWVNEGGQMLDYQVGNVNWNSNGFDLEKHIFTTKDSEGNQGLTKIRGWTDTHWDWPESNPSISTWRKDGDAGVCKWGSNDIDACGLKVFMDFSADGVEVPKFTGVWDLESLTNQWTGDNASRFHYSLYCRAKSAVGDFTGKRGNFCDDKAAGTQFLGGSTEAVECGTKMGSNWIKVATQAEFTCINDCPEQYLDQPAWATEMNQVQCNTWLFEDHGSWADLQRSHQNWTGEGFDFQKNVFIFYQNGLGTRYMHKMGLPDYWVSQSEATDLPEFSSARHNEGSCKSGADDMPDGACAGIFQTKLEGWNFKGIWDVESWKNHATGDNSFRYSYTLWCSWT